MELTHHNNLIGAGSSVLHGPAFDRAFVLLCAGSFPLFSASILVLQPSWSAFFLALAVAVSIIGLFTMHLRPDLYARGLIFFLGFAVFLAVKLLHDWALSLPIRIEGYASLVARVIVAILVALALSDKLLMMLRALCLVSVAFVVHAILSQVLVIFVEPGSAPFLDAADANSFTYTQIAWLFFYSQRMFLSDALHIYRAHGVMWEPGIFQFFCNYLILCGFRLFNGSKRKALIGLGLAGVIVSTSTMGAAIAAIIILINTKFSWRSFVAVVAIVVVPSIFAFATKFDLSAAQGLSTVIRLIDLEVPLTYAIKFPLLGVGNDSSVVQQLGVHSYLLDYLLGSVQSDSLTHYVDEIFDTDRIFNTSNGLLALLMQYGLIFTGAYIYGIRNFSRQSGLGASFFALILLTCFNEPISLTVLFLWMAVHGVLLPSRAQSVTDARVGGRATRVDPALWGPT
jgi:hypothetical protein